jgi:hypothetical protein
MAAVHELQVHEQERPVLTEVVADDATPEAVTELLIEQGGALAVMRRGRGGQDAGLRSLVKGVDVPAVLVGPIRP